MKNGTRVRVMWAAIMAVFLAFCLSVVVGQEGAAPSPAPAPVAAAPGAPALGQPGGAVEQVSTKTLGDYWRIGGWCMYPIGLLSVIMVALIVYGFMMVAERRMLTPHLVGPITEAVRGLRIDDAMSMCTSTPSLLTNVLHAGLQRISGGVLDVSSMEKSMEEATIEETSQGLRMISYLSIVGQTAPMWGLLGTVSGMIKAFEKIGKGQMGKPEVLAENIGEAMITTFAGLVVGIPAMCFYFYLKSRYTENLTHLGRVLGNLSHQLVTASREAAEGGVPGATSTTSVAAGQSAAQA